MVTTIRLFFLFSTLLLTGAMLPCRGQERRFPADAVVDVTTPPFGARPDDGLDDTAALQRAITASVGSGRVIYVPAGTYRISGTLAATNAQGVWDAQLTLQGAGRDRTVLQLVDRAPGFGDPAHPRPLVVTASHWEAGDAADGGGNKAFRNNLFDLTIETGAGNPGAIGVAYAVSNHGAIERVAIRSHDRGGVAGIALTRQIPGPGLIRDVEVDGFDVGVDVGDIQYGLTLEDVSLHAQRVAGLRTSRNLVYVRHLTSVNAVPAVRVTDPLGGLVLLEAQLTGGATSQVAVDCAGSLLLRRVTTAGYAAPAVRARGRGLPGPYDGTACVPAALGATPAPAAGLLDVEETPDYWNADPADWIAVGERRPGEADDTAAFQRAIDSGHGTVYLRNDHVTFLSGTVVVRGAVRQILGQGAELSLGAAREPFSDPAHPRPLFRIDPTAAAVFLDNLFLNAQYPGVVIFENNNPGTVVIRHCGGWVGSDGHRQSYRNTPQAMGRLFLEDNFLPGWTFTRQRVWARQLNPENWDGDGTAPQVLNSGSRLWIFGFKTEGAAPFIETRDGGITELLGGYNYVSATKAGRVPADAVPYVVNKARAALTFVSDNFRENDYRVYVRETQGGATRDWRGADLWPRNGHPGDRSMTVPLFLAAGASQEAP